jgi:hypothetical protein
MSRVTAPKTAVTNATVPSLRVELDNRIRFRQDPHSEATADLEQQPRSGGESYPARRLSDPEVLDRHCRHCRHCRASGE